MQERESDVARYWDETLDTCGIRRSDGREQAWNQLVAAYSETHRHYHNLNHIAEVLDALLAWEFELEDWKPVFLAGIYHDVVYDPHRSDNEQKSADLAANALAKLGVAHPCVARTQRLILCTKDHAAPDDDSDALLFLGADLAILAYPPERYEEYRQAIRKEYEWVPDERFCLGRRQVLQGFLDRPCVFRSRFLTHLESRARTNLAAEIAQIDEILRTL